MVVVTTFNVNPNWSKDVRVAFAKTVPPELTILTALLLADTVPRWPEASRAMVCVEPPDP
jgi:hypothetical protein